MKIVSIDIETTGVNKLKDQICQVGAVIFDTASETFNPKVMSWYVKLDPSDIHGSLFAIKMNADILDICTAKWPEKFDAFDIMEKMLITKETFADTFKWWLDNNDAYDEGEKSIVFAGKNVGLFDIPFMENFFDNFSSIRYKHRLMDPTPLCTLPNDTVPPDLKTCIDRTFGGSHQVKHLGYCDAMDVAMILYAKIRNLWSEEEKKKVIECAEEALNKFDEIEFALRTKLNLM